MRQDIVEIGYAEMGPPLRALIAYEPNGALDLVSPQPLLAEILRRSPVVRWEQGVGFFAMADVVAGCRNTDLVSQDPVTGINFGMGSAEPLIPLHLDGPRHVFYRKLLAPLVSARKMARLQPAIRTLADRLIDRFVSDGAFDSGAAAGGSGSVELHDAFCVPLPSTIFLELFGLPLEDMAFLVDAKDQILKNDGATREEKEQLGLAAGRRLQAHLRIRLAERRAERKRRDDLLDGFIHFEVDGKRLDDAAVVNIMQMFTIAGLDTVVSSLSCIVAWFARHGEARQRVVADPTLLPEAIEELLRFESPTPSSGARWAARDTEINGVPVKKGEMVYFCWASANLDPAAFDRPLVPDLARKRNSHVAFAIGTHHCIGSHFARIQLRTAIDQLHRRMPDYHVTPGEEVKYEFGGVRQAKHLPLEFRMT